MGLCTFLKYGEVNLEYRNHLPSSYSSLMTGRGARRCWNWNVNKTCSGCQWLATRPGRAKSGQPKRWRRRSVRSPSVRGRITNQDSISTYLSTLDYCMSLLQCNKWASWFFPKESKRGINKKRWHYVKPVLLTKKRNVLKPYNLFQISPVQNAISWQFMRKI